MKYSYEDFALVFDNATNAIHGSSGRQPEACAMLAVAIAIMEVAKAIKEQPKGPFAI